MSPLTTSTEDDPVQAEYNVYINPHLPGSSELYILQFPNREAAKSYSTSTSSLPTELRLKPKSGLLELDVPMDVWRNYDRQKGVKWGEAVKKSSLMQGGGSHGLPGGFGIGSGNTPRARREEDEVGQGVILKDFPAAVTQQRVLTKQTLGGQTVPKETTTPQYMVGVFRGDQLHLTPVDQIVQMRPQFHHIDAFAELEKSSRPREPVTNTGAPRAIHMTVKASIDGEEETTDTMAERIRTAQEEPWRRMNYIDEDTTDAWEKYEGLFADTTADASVLVSTMGNDEYLDAISAPRDKARLSRSKKVRRDRDGKKGQGKDGCVEGESDSSSTNLSDILSSEESENEVVEL